MAEAILNRLGAGKFKAYSAGSQPKGDVHPGALMLLQVKGYNLTELRSKSWDGFIGAGINFDHIISVCNNAAGEVCPIIPGDPANYHWDIPDPAAARDIPMAFVVAYNMLEKKISGFVASHSL